MLTLESMLEQKLNELKLTNVLVVREKKICFEDSVENRCVDGLVWDHNTMALPVTLDPLGCESIIRHLNGTNNKILSNLHYNKTSTLLEDHYFQEILEQYQTPFTVYQDKDWNYDPSKNPYHNCPAHHQFESNLVSWRFEVSEIELTYGDTEYVMIIDKQNLPFCFANKPLKLLLLLFGFAMIFA